MSRNKKQDTEARPLRADAARNRERVLDVARGLIEARGVDVEMGEIARAAGVGVGTIYRHFPTKEALVHSVGSRFVEDLVEAARLRAEAPDAAKALFEFVVILGDTLAAKESLNKALEGTLSPEQATRRRDSFRAALGMLLERAQDAGAVRRDVTVADLVALVRGTLASFGERPDTASRRRRLAIVCEGIRKK